MKLIYIWSKEYRRMSATGRCRNDFAFDGGFLLSSDYNVEYSPDKGEVRIEKRESNVEGFFGRNISEIIAIVGANGNGKTTVLNMLAEVGCCSEYEYDDMCSDYIKIFEEDDKTLSIFYCIKKRLRYVGDQSIKVSMINLRNNEMAGKKIEQEFSGIFISNNFEWRDLYGLSSLSINENTQLIQYNFAQQLKYMYGFSEDLCGATLEDRRVIKKIQRYGQCMDKDKLSKITTDQMRLIVSSMRYFPTHLKQELSGIYGSFKVDIKDFARAFDLYDENQFLKYCDYKTCFEYERTKYILYACFKLILFEASYFFTSSVYKMIRDYFDYEQEEVVNIEFLKQVIEKLRNDITIETWKFDIDNLKWFQQLLSSVEIFEKYKDERLYKGSYNFSTRYAKRFLEFLSDVFDKNVIFFQRVLIFKPYPASTGESVLAYFFSYIHNAIYEKTKSKSIAIFIDEVDATLHPRWQQSILWYLLEYLNSYNGYQFQIIFTTHSPLILSDLTEERIIRLERDKNNIRILSKGNPTFGANIMRLYYDDFFMDEGSIGEFAKQKIKKVIDYFNGKINNLSLKEVEYIIDHIGEPTVKSILMKRLNKAKLDEEQQLKLLIADMGVQEAIKRLQRRG